LAQHRDKRPQGLIAKINGREPVLEVGQHAVGDGVGGRDDEIEASVEVTEQRAV